MSYLKNDKGVCRTAAATPGLLMIGKLIMYTLIFVLLGMNNLICQLKC